MALRRREIRLASTAAKPCEHISILFLPIGQAASTLLLPSPVRDQEL